MFAHVSEKILKLRMDAELKTKFKGRFSIPMPGGKKLTIQFGVLHDVFVSIFTDEAILILTLMAPFSFPQKKLTEVNCMSNAMSSADRKLYKEKIHLYNKSIISYMWYIGLCITGNAMNILI